MTIAEQWRAALADVRIRHPNPEYPVTLTIHDDGVLQIGLAWTRDSRDPSNIIRDFVVSNVRLTYFPGVRLARKWLAAAWAGYTQHEALELVTVGDLETRPLDPHEDPYTTCPWNRGLRDGFPVELTPSSMIDALAVVMDHDAARVLVGAA